MAEREMPGSCIISWSSWARHQIRWCMNKASGRIMDRRVSYFHTPIIFLHIRIYETRIDIVHRLAERFVPDDHDI